MNDSVPDEVIKETTKCLSEFSCLTNGLDDAVPGCAVEIVLGKNLLFVKPKHKSVLRCPYLMHYGSGYLCRCPTHSYLATKLRK